MFQTIVSYLSFAVAWQGVFAVALTVYSLFEHFAGKRLESGTSREEEKIKLLFFATWFLITLTGFYYDAVSSPPFAQAFSLVDSELSLLVGYVSVFGSILCLVIYAPYKIGSTILYLYRNKDTERRSSAIDFHDDVYFGDMIVIESSIWTVLTGNTEVGGEKVDVEITYPPLADIPEPLREVTRTIALERSTNFCKELEAKYTEYGSGLAYLLSRDEKAAGKTLSAITAGLQLSRAECDYWFEQGTDLDSGTFTLTYRNTNDFGELELVAGVTDDGGVYLIDDEDLSDDDAELLQTDEPAIEQAEDSVEYELDKNLSDETPVTEDDKTINQSYL